MPKTDTKQNGVSKGYIPKILFITRLIALLLLVSLVQVNASILTKLYQAIDLKGKVIDINGAPMPGVSVNVKGTKKSTVTNGQGVFTIAASSGDILVLKMIGYASQEMTGFCYTIIFFKEFYKKV